MSAKTTPQRLPAPALITLANASRPRRPLGARTATVVDVFGSHAAAALNRFAEQASFTQTLHVGADGALTVDVHWHSANAVAELACRIVAELGRLDPARLRRCAREACDFLYYDTTRPGTQRWHSESPCGLRERQARWRRAAAAGDKAISA